MAEAPFPPLHNLMYGLLYPAVLGTGIVLTAVRAAHDGTASQALLDPTIHIAITAAIFFMASFVSAFYWPNDTSQPAHIYGYTKWAFFSDLLEIGLMFACFHFLGLFELPTLVPPDLIFAYAALAFDVLWQIVWRRAVHIEDWSKLWWLRCLIAAVLMISGFFGKTFPCITISVLFGVAAFVVYYISQDPRYPHQSHH